MLAAATRATTTATAVMIIGLRFLAGGGTAGCWPFHGCPGPPGPPDAPAPGAGKPRVGAGCCQPCGPGGGAGCCQPCGPGGGAGCCQPCGPVGGAGCCQPCWPVGGAGCCQPCWPVGGCPGWYGWPGAG